MNKNSNTRGLLILSIGPVQPFITTARRAQDLWLGSRVLSDLIRAGIEKALEADIELIYPAPETLEEAEEAYEGGLPNKFVAHGKARNAQEAAQNAEEAVCEAWKELAKDVREYLENEGIAPSRTNWNIWERQVEPKHWLEIYWAISPEKEPYGTAYRDLIVALDARKRLRDFAPVDEPGEKCTLCGQRQALHGSEDWREAIRKFWTKISAHKEVGAAQVKPEGQERLCAVCTVKRFALEARDEEERFPSTSSVATAPFVLELLENAGKLRTALDAHQKALKSIGLKITAKPRAIPYLWERRGAEEALLCCDGDMFFPETFTVERLKKDYGRKVKEAAEAAQKVRELWEAAGSVPLPYFAVLAMDGDRMGRRLSQVQGVDEHQEISKTLFEFARDQVPEIVEKKRPGRMIYAGGDDVLALLPVACVLPAAQELRHAFAQALAGGTMSAGVAIAHQMSPLQDALETARRAERQAKDGYGRDALCVALLRRSGEAVQVGAHWIFGCGQRTVDLLEEVRLEISKGWLSGKLAFALSEEAATLAALPREAQIAELRRLLRRQRAEGLSDQEKEEIENLAEPLVALAESLDPLVRSHRDGDKPRSGMEELAGWLLLTRFLAGEGGGQR